MLVTAHWSASGPSRLNDYHIEFAATTPISENLLAGCRKATTPENVDWASLRAAFTVWKNTAGLKEGYVTGLEPSTSYPNARPFENARNRIVTLPPGGSHVVETTLELLDSAQGVAAVEAEIKALQKIAPTIHRRPVEPFAPEG